MEGKDHPSSQKRIEIKFDKNRYITLDDPTAAWFVQNGQVNVFAVVLKDGRPAGRWRHLFQAEIGQVLFGIDEECSPLGWGLIACGTAETQLLRVSRDGIISTRMANGNPQLMEALAFAVESWLIALSAGVWTDMPPTDYIAIEPEEQIAVVPSGKTARPTGDFAWFQLQDGQANFTDSLIIQKGTTMPVAATTWLTATEECRVEGLYTVDLIDCMDISQSALWSAMAEFHRHVMATVAAWGTKINETEKAWVARRRENDARMLQQAFDELAAVTDKSRLVSAKMGNPLVVACRLVAEVLKVEVGHVVTPGNGDFDYEVRSIARQCSFQVRKVLLSDQWWLKNSGPLLASRENDGSPVALLQQGSNRYSMHDPVTGQKIRVDAEIASSLAPFAYMFYRSLPNKAILASDLIRFCASVCTKSDMVMALLMGIGGGVIAMAPPLAIGVLFDSIIPAADNKQILSIFLLLLACTGVEFTFFLVRSLTMLRIENQMNVALQAAVWDRLLNLPTAFFRDFSAGDLAVRANGINAIRMAVSGLAVSSLFAGLFSCFNLVLLFFYNVKLAGVAIGLTAIALIFNMVLYNKQGDLQKVLAQMEGKIAGLLLQMICGIAKFRMAGAENRAFYLWSREFSHQRRTAVRVRTMNNYLTVFSTVYPLIAVMIIFGLQATNGGLTTGKFLSFNAAFTGFLTAMLGLAATMSMVSTVAPLYERAKPILRQLPEADEAKISPGRLNGFIDVSHLSFRYSQDGPLVLDDLSLSVRQGEFVAIVGSSGSGKSTLFRMLLGFESPDKGSVFYDGKELSNLDVRHVRGQLGVVLQNDRLMAGTILNNIIGVTNLTVDDAWEATRQAGVAQDIKKMPMGMHTVIGDSASTLSGGQRQRILIARAIVKKPRILFFDEATSALDNQTQAVVSQSLKQLKSTRVVIAHRLSTIIDADRIYVLDQGRIVQCGTYGELIEQPGVFAELAKRQLA